MRVFARLVVCVGLIGLSSAAHAQVPDSVDRGLREAGWTQVVQPYTAPTPYQALWAEVGARCLGLRTVPPLADWAWYSVDAKAFLTVWTGQTLVVGVTDGPGHRIYLVHRNVHASGSVAHEMLHAMLYALGREWKAAHPRDGHDAPPNAADAIFAACGLWPVPDAWSPRPRSTP